MNFYRKPGVKELWASEVISLSELSNFCCMLDARNSNPSWAMKFAIINKSPEPQDPSLKLRLTLKYCNFDYFHVFVVHIIYFLIFSWMELKGWSKRECKKVSWLYGECYFLGRCRMQTCEFIEVFFNKLSLYFDSSLPVDLREFRRMFQQSF